MERQKVTRRDFLRLSVGTASVVVAATALTACATSTPAPAKEPTAAPATKPSPTAAEKKRIVAWNLGDGPQPFQEALVKKFNDSHPNIDLQYDPALAGIEWQAGMQKLRVALDNQTGPDVAATDTGAALESMVASGQVLDLTDAYQQYGWNTKIPKRLVDDCIVEGKPYSVPNNVETVGIFYNQDLYGKVGAAAPPKTFDEYIQGLEMFKKAGNYGYAIGLAGGWPSAYMASEFMYLSAGTEYSDVLSGKRKWTESERCLNGMTIYHSIVKNGYTNPDVLGIDQDQANDLFFQGKTAGTLNGNGFFRSIMDAKPSFKTSFFYLPPIDPKSDVKCLGGIGSSLFAAKYSKNKDAALELINWLMSPEIAGQVLIETGAVRPIQFTIPKDADPLLANLATETQKYVGEVGFWPVTYLAPAVFGKLNALIQGMMGDKLTPAQVMQEMQKAYEDYLKQKSG
ncbi:MAG: extracellular solute-binding protein [Anaerolineae bacterium]|nr:extracellular solute-binding protein [Anaerolineae bacterium]